MTVLVSNGGEVCPDFGPGLVFQGEVTLGDGAMRIAHPWFTFVAAVSAIFVALATPLRAQQVAIDADDIGGVVRSSSGPEAGVWVIAETADLPTKFAKMVVTDDQGRYVIPDLPK